VHRRKKLIVHAFFMSPDLVEFFCLVLQFSRATEGLSSNWLYLVVNLINHLKLKKIPQRFKANSLRETSLLYTFLKRSVACTIIFWAEGDGFPKNI